MSKNQKQLHQMSNFYMKAHRLQFLHMNEENFIVYTCFIENPSETAGISAYFEYKLPMNPS